VTGQELAKTLAEVLFAFTPLAAGLLVVLGVLREVGNK
jgi:hypothetical protein